MKIVFISLGCDKNTVDTQKMAGSLQDTEGRYTFTDDETAADIYNLLCGRDIYSSSDRVTSPYIE